MKKRGMKHKSFLPAHEKKELGFINVDNNLIDLHKRCKECRKNGR